MSLAFCDDGFASRVSRLATHYFIVSNSDILPRQEFYGDQKQERTFFSFLYVPLDCLENTDTTILRVLCEVQTTPPVAGHLSGTLISLEVAVAAELSARLHSR